VATCLWLGDNSDIVYGKTSTSIILIGYGPTPPLGQSNHLKVAWNFFVKFVVAPVAAAARVFDCVVATKPNLTFWALQVRSLA
jgi:hypothetical protein